VQKSLDASLASAQDEALEIQARITEEKNAKIAQLKAVEQEERAKMDLEIKKMEEEMEEMRQKEKEAMEARRSALKTRGQDNASRLRDPCITPPAMAWIRL
jgi:predicted RNA-binding protein with RPS1 domain